MQITQRIGTNLWAIPQFLFLTLCFSTASFAQNASFTGHVTDPSHRGSGDQGPHRGSR
jgi:hypothetical protein